MGIYIGGIIVGTDTGDRQIIYAKAPIFKN
jgi:hypothetical protein